MSKEHLANIRYYRRLWAVTIELAVTYGMVVTYFNLLANGQLLISDAVSPQISNIYVYFPLLVSCSGIAAVQNTWKARI